MYSSRDTGAGDRRGVSFAYKKQLNEKTAIYFPRRYQPASKREGTLFSTEVNEWKRGKKAVRADRAGEGGGGDSFEHL